VVNLRAALVVTPILAIATLAVGMRIGAKRTVHAAVVYGAPRAHGASAFAWQVITLVENEGTRETEPRAGITVRARAKGQQATWHGDSNEDGVAEVRLELPGVGRGDAVDLSITGEGLPEPLAEGRVTWDDAAWASAAPAPFVRAAKREGPIALDVAVLGTKLVVRGFVPVMVRATSRDDGHALSNVTIATEPDPEIEVRQTSVTTCALGWARVDTSARIYLGGLGLHATLPDGRKGEWYGSLPVATGSIRSVVDDVVVGFDAVFPVQAKTPVYAEFDDAEGRASGAWAKLPGPEGDRAAVHVPDLSPGLKWFVTSTEPHGAEVFDEGATARPFLVGGTASAPMPPGVPPANDTCAVEGYLATHPAGGFHRFTALDGFVARKDANGARRKRGMTIGLTSLAVGSVLELFLLLQAARSGRRLAASAVEGIEPGAELVQRSSVVSVVVGALLALLGFALFAAILLLRQ
jgi:hypothetical protein